VGFDISEELIKLAREHVPEARFEVADAVAYEYGENKFDAVFAFAALLHLDKEEVRSVLEKVARALKPGGVFYISLKHRKTYQTEVKEDKYGKRLFYFYNPELIKELAANLYEVASEDIEKIGGTNWLEMTLRRK
jgi:ubiquinone/menaquinone biosynthesis C-methylase UbiE